MLHEFASQVKIMNAKTYIIAVALAVVIAGIGYYLYTSSAKPQETNSCADEGDTHDHADFLVYLDGTAFDFNGTTYMEKEGAPGEAESRLHLHDDIGTVLHKHWKGATWGEFFDNIGMALNDTCFTLDNGTAYCNDAATGKTLKMFVNGTRIGGNFSGVEPMDLDRMLISYGNDDAALQMQMASVADVSCLFSDRCPARGWPPGYEQVTCKPQKS
jgi:hypothetical protein